MQGKWYQEKNPKNTCQNLAKKMPTIVLHPMPTVVWALGRDGDCVYAVVKKSNAWWPPNNFFCYLGFAEVILVHYMLGKWLRRMVGQLWDIPGVSKGCKVGSPIQFGWQLKNDTPSESEKYVFAKNRCIHVFYMFCHISGKII